MSTSTWQQLLYNDLVKNTPELLAKVQRVWDNPRNPVSTSINLICWESKYQVAIHCICGARSDASCFMMCPAYQSIPEYKPRSFATFWVTYWQVLGATCFASLSSTSPPRGLGRSSGAKEDKTPKQAGPRNGSCPNPLLDTTYAQNISRRLYGHRIYGTPQARHSSHSTPFRFMVTVS